MAWDPAALIEVVDDAVAVFTPDAVLVHANPAAERMFGRPLAELLGTRLWDLIGHDGVIELRAAFERAVSTRQRQIFDHRATERRHWCRNHVYVAGDHVHVVTRDITEQKESERRLSVLASASHAFGAADRDMRTILDLLARFSAAEIGEIAVANILSRDGAHLEPIAQHADRELAQEVQALLDRPVPVAGTLSAHVLESGTTLRVNAMDVEAFAQSTPQHFSAMVRRFQPRAFMMVPIRFGGRVMGTLAVSRMRSPTPYCETEQRLAEELADRASLALENARVLDGERVARQSAERIAAFVRRLHAITTQLTHRRSAREVAATVLTESTEALGGPTGAIWLLDDSGRMLEMLAQIGYADPSLFAQLPLDGPAPLCSAVRDGAPCFLANVREYAEQFPESAKRALAHAPREFATACLPLFSEGRAIGGIAFAYPHAHEFTADERTFIDVLTDHCAQSIDRSRLLEQERAASAAHAEANRTLNAIIRSSPAAIAIADGAGVIRLWNPAAETMFGWSAEELIGRAIPSFSDERSREIRENIGKVLRGEPITGFETVRTRRDGTSIDVALYAAPLQRPDGETHALVLCVDITDRKRAEEAARAADRRKDEFLAMLGHELRNPLAPIMTALDLMKLRGEIGNERERATIERQTRHLVRLVDDLLDIARVTRGKLQLHHRRVDLGTVIAQAVEMTSPLLEQRGHHVSIAAPRGRLFVDGDEMRLAQVFQNLLTNAAKYTPQGGSIAVRASARDGQAIVEVDDNGEGIHADVLPTIFEPFVQGTRKIDRQQGGLGIGLALVHNLVGLHGGSVEAHSEGPGRGSRFVIQVPLATALVESDQAPPPVVRGRGARRRILLVDDNRDAAEMMADLLRAAGHEVLVAFDGPSALDGLPTFAPEVALLDIGLPVMDGYDLARKLRDLLPKAPRLVALTGYGQEHDHRRSKDAGFDAHLVKPVQAAQVLAAVDDAFS